MRATAIILARAGSKGLPAKNLIEIGGRPCAAWTISDARGAETISRIILTTDSPELQQMGVEAGIDVVARPEGLASDSTPIDEAARHAVDAAQDDSDAFVILYANVPVRPEGLIDRAVRLLGETSADSVQSYAPVGKYHPWWMTVVDPATGDVRPWQGDVLNNNVYRRQDLPPAHVPDGGVIAVSRAALLLEVAGVPEGPHAFFGADRRGILTEPGDVVDIDSERDWRIAEAILIERMP